MELEASGLQIGYGEHVIVNQMDVSIARDKITRQLSDQMALENRHC